MSFGISDSDREILNWAKTMKEQQAANPQGETKPAANPQGDTNNYSQLDNRITNIEKNINPKISLEILKLKGDLEKESKSTVDEIEKVNAVNRLQIKGLNTEDGNLRKLIKKNINARKALRAEVTVLQNQVKKVANHVGLKL
jgi:hypothetical protein